MTNVSAYNALNAGIYSKLTGGTALITSLGGTAIYYGQAPDDANLPYVVWSYQYSAPDNMTPRESTQQVVYIRAYAGAAAQAGTIDGLICDLLHKGSVTASGWNNFWIARETEFAYPEVDEAKVTTWTAGAYYRVRMDK